jgi:hypothetical protein
MEGGQWPGDRKVPHSTDSLPIDRDSALPTRYCTWQTATDTENDESRVER